MRSSKLIFSPGGFIFDRCLFFCYMISGFPLCPHALPDIEFLPIFVCAGELLRAEHGVFCCDEKCRVGDAVVGPLSFGLGILEFVDVLEDSLSFEVAT